MIFISYSEEVAVVSLYFLSFYTAFTKVCKIIFYKLKSLQINTRDGLIRSAP